MIKSKKALMIAWMILLFGISLAYYWCMIDLAYRGDDWLNANVEGVYYYTGESIWEVTLRIMKSWLEAGRFFPCSAYTYYLFAVFNTLHSYRIFLFCITLIMVMLSGLVIKKLTNSYLMTVSFISLAPMMFYLSEYGACNPLLCYHGLMQFTVIWFMCSMLCLFKWLDVNKGIFAFFATVFYFMSLCTYEVAYGYIVFAVFAVLYKESNICNAIRKILPVFAAWIGGLLVNAIVRNGAVGGYAGVQMSFSIGRIANTALCMLAAAFPIYSAFATGYIFELSDISMGDAVLSFAFAFAFVFAFYFFKEEESSKRSRVIIYCMGFSLWIFPALLIGLSARWQNEVRWGTDWLPYFVEVIGVSIIFIQFCKDLYTTIAHSTCWKWMKHMLSLCLFILIGFMALWNRTAAEHSYSKTEMNAFNTIRDALELGILNDISDEDIIHVVPTIGSEHEPYIFYSRFARKKCNADILTSEEQFVSMDYSAYKNEYIAKKIDLGSDRHIFVIGLYKDGALNIISWPLIYIPDCEDNEFVLFSLEKDGTEMQYEIFPSNIVKMTNDNGIIVQVPHERVILDSIQIKMESDD